MNAEQRLEIETLVFAHDSMVAALERLRIAASALDPRTIEPVGLAELFEAAWTIVNQTDISRQILHRGSSDEKGPMTRAYLSDMQVARSLRNRISHLSQHLPNLANRTGPVEGLFGSLSFFRCSWPAIELAKATRSLSGEHILISYGALPGLEGRTSTTFNTYEAVRPISNLYLNAFGERFRLDEPCDRLADILTGMSETVATQLDDNAAVLARDLKITEAEVRFGMPSVVSSVAQLTFPYGTEAELAAKVVAGP